jgi:hypothetical protein
MKRHELFRKLIVRAPPDIVVALYQRCRPLEASGATPSWEEIVRAAQGIGIFTIEEARVFLELVPTRGVSRDRSQSLESTPSTKRTGSAES